MRTILLAGVTTLGAIGAAIPAFAQDPAPAPTSFVQGKTLTPLTGGPSYLNNNNNYQAAVLRGAVANPTPGTIVIHINGRLQFDYSATWSSLDAFAPAALTFAGVTLVGPHTAKIQPNLLSSYARLYFGGDGMAANGLRYGAAIELRQNFIGQIGSTASTGASGYTSAQTVYVRRAFGYVAGENWGIVRFGEADGLIGIFDNGVTTFQFLPTSNLQGGDLQTNVTANTTIPFAFLSQAANEYGNSKLVYLSPQFAGFDFGFQWAPNTSNGFGIGGPLGPPNAGFPAACAVATTGCPNLSSSSLSTDGARIMNQTAVGVRYQGLIGDVGLLAYGVYEFSGHANYTGPFIANPSAAFGSSSTGRFDNLSFGSMGVAVTFAGVTVGGNVITGAVNGQGVPRPVGGAPTNGWLIGAKYVTGPLTVGIVGESIDSQGSTGLVGISQRKEQAVSTGVSYVIAPGLTAYVEYMYQRRHQGAFNFGTGANLSGAYNDVKSQGVMAGTVVNF